MNIRIAVCLAMVATIARGAVLQFFSTTQKPVLHARHWIAVTGKPLGAMRCQNSPSL